MQFYVDSNVFVSYFNQEDGGGFQIQYHRCTQFFEFVKEEDHVIVLSGLTFKEIEKHTGLSKGDILEFLDDAKICYEVCQFTDTIRRNERVLRAQGIHKPDSYHAAYALLAKCKWLVTWNKKDFKPVNRRIKILSPEDLV